MIHLPSVELLSEVLKGEVLRCSTEELASLGANEVFLYFDGYKQKWNIYELAHKCKEWAYNKGFMLFIFYANNIVHVRCIVDGYEKRCYGSEKDEESSVIEMCEWLLTQSKA